MDFGAEDFHTDQTVEKFDFRAVYVGDGSFQFDFRLSPKLGRQGEREARQGPY